MPYARSRSRYGWSPASKRPQRPGWSPSLRLRSTGFDYDNDGDVDLYVANDSTPNRLYRNRGDATFEEVGTLTGSAYNSDGRLQGSMGTHFGDYDGDLDLAVSNQDERPTLLENTTATENHWVTVELVGTQTLGARLEVRAGGILQIRQRASGGSYASHSDSRLHVGLGDAAVIDRLTVTWPDGARTSCANLPGDRFYSVSIDSCPPSSPGS